MIFVVARFLPKPGAREAVLEVLRETVPAVHREPGCLLYAPYLSVEDDAVMLFEAWADGAALAQHGEAPAVGAQRTELQHALRAPIEVTRYTELPMGEADRGALRFAE